MIRLYSLALATGITLAALSASLSLGVFSGLAGVLPPASRPASSS